MEMEKTINIPVVAEPMETYRVSCNSNGCGMKEKVRVAQSTAKRLAERHVDETGHTVTVVKLGDSHEKIVVEE